MGLPLSISGLAWAFEPGQPAFLRVEALSLGAGEVLAVTGPSGAGKSTLLALLAGLESAPAGALRWGDQDLGALSPGRRDAWRRKNLGLVFQDFQLVPELTAAENVLLPVTFGRCSVPAAERRRAEALLDRLGVARHQARAGTLSRGEMQRTALARALFGRPGVLLADEPTASLDAANEASVTDLLVSLARQEGATVVVATHQPGLVHRADRLVRVDHGQVQEAAR